MALERNLIANFLGHGWVALMGLAFIPLHIKYLDIEASRATIETDAPGANDAATISRFNASGQCL